MPRNFTVEQEVYIGSLAQLESVLTTLVEDHGLVLPTNSFLLDQIEPIKTLQVRKNSRLPTGRQLCDEEMDRYSDRRIPGMLVDLSTVQDHYPSEHVVTYQDHSIDAHTIEPVTIFISWADEALHLLKQRIEERTLLGPHLVGVDSVIVQHPDAERTQFYLAARPHPEIPDWAGHVQEIAQGMPKVDYSTHRADGSKINP
ncbi:MAG: hypothetical protein QF915_04835 [Candidatus Woesearchaeota archaeon]|jgi:hypothetical protein|nr:hypothetical protein [Candidatus Woesearchaeota archaeon]MDP7458556.1 hypothetical protein [Candidatus Woesearchaeota archaeon]